MRTWRAYLEKSFEARRRVAQDRVMALRGRERSETQVALARQQAERELEDRQGARAVAGFAGMMRARG